jgi:penicillin amidase
VKDSATYIDTVAYTVFGPVMYDKSFKGNHGSSDKNYAVRWKAHDPSNELKTFILLNHGKNYSDYLNCGIKFSHTGTKFCLCCKVGRYSNAYARGVARKVERAG